MGAHKAGLLSRDKCGCGQGSCFLLLLDLPPPPRARPAPAQAAEVRKVKKYRNGFITDPLCLKASATVADVLRLKEEHGFAASPSPPTATSGPGSSVSSPTATSTLWRTLKAR